MRLAASAAIAERSQRSELEEFSPGACLVAPSPGGVVLLIDEDPDDLEGLVRTIASALSERGVEGAFDLYEPQEVIVLPDAAPLLECRLRVKGTRPPSSGITWRWRADTQALGAGVEAGVAWCLEGRDDRPLQLVVATVPPVMLGEDDDAGAYVRQAVDLTPEGCVVRLTSQVPDGFRTVAISPSFGRITIIEGGSAIESAGWRSSVPRVVDWMVSASSWAVYGFVKRGSYRPAAELGTSLSQDWVRVPHFSANSLLGQAFEDEWAPDAFGAQLLGPGYAGRLPGGRDWTHTPAGVGAVLVAHVDPESWFDGRLVPFGGHPVSTTADAEPIPDVVAEARDAFAEILFRDETAGLR